MREPSKQILVQQVGDSDDREDSIIFEENFIAEDGSRDCAIRARIKRKTDFSLGQRSGACSPLAKAPRQENLQLPLKNENYTKNEFSSNSIVYQTQEDVDDQALPLAGETHQSDLNAENAALGSCEEGKLNAEAMFDY